MKRILSYYIIKKVICVERLQKVIAKAGICSRRKAEVLITEGKVKVNGEVVTTLGTTVSEEDKIYVEGKLLKSESKAYYVLNKARNTISSVSDEKGRKTVMDGLEINKRIYPVGRLDFDTTGVLILTNDGELANALLHPSSNVNKVYIATIEGSISDEELNKLETGVEIDEKMTSPCKAERTKVNKEKNKTIVKLTIHEGRNHQVKKMFEAINKNVLKLHRDEFAGISSKGLYEGQHRKLTFEEVKNLKKLAFKK